MTRPSIKLIRFYREYAQWLHNGAPDREPFRRCVGLCTALRTDYTVVSQETRMELKREMQDQFEAAGLDRSFPFGTTRYYELRESNTQHLDPERIAWVREHAKWNY